MKKAALELAVDYGYDSVKDCDFSFNDKHVFIACFKEPLYTGLPQFILVTEDGSADFADPVDNINIFDIYASARHRKNDTERA